jgi:hypothetical protein
VITITPYFKKSLSVHIYRQVRITPTG